MNIPGWARAAARSLCSIPGAIVLIAVYIFVAVHPYTGIRHDSIIYVAQALYRLQPDVFASDLFFKYGSQENFTLFGRWYAAMISRFGFQPATLGMLIASQLLFFAATIAWTRRTLPTALWPWGVVAVSLASGIYGGALVFRFAEPFLTARPYAEATCIFALTLMVGGRRWLPLALMGLAALLHPLVTLPALAIWWIVQVETDRRWLWALAGVPLVMLAGWKGIAPFATLFEQYDPVWRESLETGNQHVFISLWGEYDFMMLATDVLLALWVRRRVQGALLQIVNAGVAAVAGGIIVSVVGADLLSDVFITSLQLWRAQWVLYFMTMAMLPVLVAPLLRGNALRLLAGMLLAYGAVNRGLVTGFAALVLATVLAWGADRWQQPDRRLVLAVGLALLGGLLAVWHNNAAWEVRLARLAPDAQIGPWDVFTMYMHKPPTGPLLVSALLLYAVWRWRARAAAVGLIGVVAIAVAAMQWDQRSDWLREVESFSAGNHPFTRYIDRQQEVFWVGDALAPWLMLHRRSYFSGTQGAGQPFNRNTAAEVVRRRTVVGLFEFHSQICGLMNKLTEDPNSCEPDIATLRAACDTDPQLAFIVTRYNLEGAWVAQWRPLSAAAYERPYHLYSCRQLLANAPK